MISTPKVTGTQRAGWSGNEGAWAWEKSTLKARKYMWHASFVHKDAKNRSSRVRRLISLLEALIMHCSVLSQF